MGALTTAGANASLNAMLGDGHGSSWPATVYLALSTTDPATTLTEPSGGGYARVAVANTTANWPNATSSTKSNAASVTFPTASAAWGVITHFAILTAASGGTVLATDALTTSIDVTSGDTPTVPAGGVVLTI